MKRNSIISIIMVVMALSGARAQNINYVSSTLWFGCSEVKIRGDYAYCAFTNGLVIINISDISHPYRYSQLQLEGGTSCIELSGNYAFLAKNCVYVVDISNPSTPFQIGQSEQIQYIYDLEISGNYIYVASLGVFTVLDISNPAQPLIAYSTQIGNIEDIEIVGEYAYVAANGLKVMNITNPASPSIVGSFSSGITYGVYVDGNYAYLATNDSYQNGHLSVLDISIPQSPSLIGDIRVQGWAGDVGIEGHYAYLSTSVRLEIIDVENPAQPLLAGHFDEPHRPDGLWKLSIDNNLIFAALSIYGLCIIDPSDPANPTLAGSYSTDAFNDIAPIGQYLYVANQLEGLQAVSITDVDNPIITGHCELPGISCHIIASDSFAYISEADNGFEIINIEDPSSPVLVSRYEANERYYGLAIKDNYILGATLTGMSVIDISNPTNPVLACSYSAPYSTQIFVQGDYVFLNQIIRIEIVNVANPDSPLHVGIYTPHGSNALTNDISIGGNYIYVVVSNLYPGGVGPLQIADISNLASPTFIRDYWGPYGAFGTIYVNGQYAYFNSPRLSIASLIDPANPVMVGSLAYAATVLGASENLIFTGLNNTITIFEFNPTDINENGIMLPGVALYQNYPNPFNTQTTISYTLAAQSDVSLNIYDLLGRKIENLLEGPQDAGKHSIIWNAGNTPSGVYFYRLKAGERTETNRMLLLK